MNTLRALTSGFVAYWQIVTGTVAAAAGILALLLKWQALREGSLKIKRMRKEVEKAEAERKQSDIARLRADIGLSFQLITY